MCETFNASEKKIVYIVEKRSEAYYATFTHIPL